jgi:hypothetical protein
VKAQERLNGRSVSVTDFFLGRPTVQRVDLNLDGRLETLRTYRRPIPEAAPGSVDPLELLDYPLDFERADSDWDGDGLFEESEYAPKSGAGDIPDE